MIMEQCKRALLSIIGMQETRSPHTRISQVNDYFIVSSATDRNRFYGCEIWVSVKFQVDDVFPTAESFVLIHADPQILLISVQLGSFLCYISTFHAPQNNAKDPTNKHIPMSDTTRAKWWENLYVIHKDLDPNIPLFCLADANATTGLQVSSMIGGLDSEYPNKNTPHFIQFLAKTRLVAPATFDRFHMGSSGTHRSSNNKFKRIDYVLVSDFLTFVMPNPK
jgi:hypothetical protein